MLAARRTFRLDARCAVLPVIAALWLLIAPGFAQQPATPGTPGTPVPTGPSGTPVAPPSVPAYRQANKVAVLRVEGVIDYVTLRSLERRVERAKREGADAVVLDINTPGGRVDAMLDICHLIKTDAPANTVAWINPQAYSAGTIIALACREIVLQENASFGDAAPVAVHPLGGLQALPPAERAKQESPLLEEVIDSARRNHYDENLVQAFVSVGVELWLIENIATGEKVFVDREEYRAVFGEEPPRELTSVTPMNSEGVTPWVGGEPGERIPSAGAEREIMTELPRPVRTRLTSADRGRYRAVRQVVAADRLLTLRPADAMTYGLAVQMIRNDEELRAYFGASSLTRYDETWSEGLARFLMSTPVRAILILVFLVALFIEIAAPGTGAFGATAVAALVILFGAPALMGMAQWWGIALVAIGLVLIAVEVLVIPGVGVAGVAGLLSLLVGLVGTFVTSDLGTSQGQAELWSGLAATLTSIFGAGVIMWLISKHLHSAPIINRLILKTELGKTGRAEDMLAALTMPSETPIAPGAIGVAHTALRPAGRGMFGGRVIDVQSPGGFVEKGTPIRVVSVGRYVVDVEEVES